MGDKFSNKIKFAQRKKAQEIKKSLIPPNVAIKNQLAETHREGNFILNFHYYNHNQCELRSVQNYRPLINKFNYITRSNPFNIQIRGSIHNNGNYANLFNDLPPDVDDLEEIDYTDAGRIIFFRVSHNFCIVSVLAKHRRN